MPIHSFGTYHPLLLVIRALANDRRIAITVFAAVHWRTLSDIAAQCGISDQAASRHVHILKRAGILVSKRKGKNVYFHLTPTWSLEDIFFWNKHLTK